MIVWWPVAAFLIMTWEDRWEAMSKLCNMHGFGRLDAQTEKASRISGFLQIFLSFYESCAFW